MNSVAPTQFAAELAKAQHEPLMVGRPMGLKWKSFQIEIAGTGVELRFHDAAGATRFEEKYRDVISVRSGDRDQASGVRGQGSGMRRLSESKSEPTVRVDVRIVPGAQFLPLEPGEWRIESELRGSKLNFRSFFESAWVDLANGTGELVMRPESDVENFLRVYYAHACLDRNALLLHAAGVIRQGRGYVFFGPSGSGKTTVTRLSATDQILSDDLVIVRKVKGTYRVFGVPFRGDMPEGPRMNLDGELAGLFRLRKAKEHTLRSVPFIRAVAELVSCVPFVMNCPDLARKVTAISQELTGCVPVQELHFRKDPDFWRVVEENARHKVLTRRRRDTETL